MTFRPRNAYYLRISTNIVLPMFLYLDERHINWMSDVVLQHVLADLRPLITPKLQAEKDVHFGPGAVPGNKRGTVEVCRRETYQFAYFFRKIEPHTVLFKSRYFVTAPLPPGAEVVPKLGPPRLAGQNHQKRRLRTQASTNKSKRKRAKTKGKEKVSQGYLDEDEWSAEGREEDTDDADPILGVPRPVRKQRRVVSDVYQELDDDDEEDRHQDVAMGSPHSGMDEGSSTESGILRTDVLSSDMADIELVVEEEEKKPKPILKLQYQSFPISGHCLCVVVEPWPPLGADAKQQSTALGTPFQRGSLEPSFQLPNGSVIAGERAKTPLFFPEYDRAPSEVPSARERAVPPVLPFRDTMSRMEDDAHSDDDLINFSQTLNAAGHMHTTTANDDDDMDGAVLFGDADEVKELL